MHDAGAMKRHVVKDKSKETKTGEFFAIGFDASPSFQFPESGFFFLEKNPFAINDITDMTVTFNSCTKDQPKGKSFKITWEVVDLQQEDK